MSSKAKPVAAKAPQKHLHSRVSFLYQAATYLTGATGTNKTSQAQVSQEVPVHPMSKNVCKPSKRIAPPLGLARHLVSHLKGVSLKAQIHQSRSIKRMICTSCEGILVPGTTSTNRIENQSRCGRKPWSDVLVIECKHCGSLVRIPVGATRQLGKNKRQNPVVEITDNPSLPWTPSN